MRMGDVEIISMLILVLRQGLEHGGRHAGMGFHPRPHQADPGDVAVGGHRSGTDIVGHRRGDAGGGVGVTVGGR